MRRILFLTLTIGALTACESTTAPASSDLALTDDLISASISLGMPDQAPGRSLHVIGRLSRLPAELKLTATQESEINALVEAYAAANKTDLQALAAILKRAHEAIKAGKSREDVKKILDEGSAIRTRLAAAEKKLQADIDAVLTAAQKAWLAENPRERCNTATTALSAAQKAQIQSLIDAFQSANAADLATVKKAHEDAMAARRAGKSRAEVQAILDAAKPAMERLQAAGQKLRADLDAVLTPEQRASNCFQRGDHAPRPGRNGPRGR